LASDIYRQRVIPSAQQMALRIGPATFLDPEIVAIHVHERKHLAAVTAYLDVLASQGVLRFWELADPETDPGDTDRTDETASAPWALIHQLPVDGQSNTAAMS